MNAAKIKVNGIWAHHMNTVWTRVKLLRTGKIIRAKMDGVASSENSTASIVLRNMSSGSKKWNLECLCSHKISDSCGPRWPRGGCRTFPYSATVVKASKTCEDQPHTYLLARESIRKKVMVGCKSCHGQVLCPEDEVHLEWLFVFGRMSKGGYWFLKGKFGETEGW